MPQPTEKLAILFADICGSTALYDNLGNDVARPLISRCIATLTEKISAHQGTLIKTIGDEVMATFTSADAALAAACAMQVAVESDLSQGGVPMHIRIGFNYGEVIVEGNDVFGNAVNVAARVAAITRAGQIMTTRAVYDALPVNLQGRMRQILRAEFKGKQESLEVYQVLCSGEDTLITRSGIPNYRKSPDNNDEMALRYRDQSLKLNKERRSVTLGRGEVCDIPVLSNFASRLHCHIELRYGKFILIDQSTNGTYVRFSDGREQHITREEIILHGNGYISLGQSLGAGADESVEFRVTSVHVAPSAASDT